MFFSDFSLLVLICRCLPDIMLTSIFPKKVVIMSEMLQKQILSSTFKQQQSKDNTSCVKMFLKHGQGHDCITSSFNNALERLGKQNVD